MLKTLAHILGLSPAPAAPPARPPSRRHTPRQAPRPPAAVVEPEEDPASVAARTAKYEAILLDNERRYAEQQRAKAEAEAIRGHHDFARAVAKVQRHYDPKRDPRRDFISDEKEVALAEALLGIEICEYLRALRHSGVRIAPIKMDGSMTDRTARAIRVDLASRCRTDIETWHKGDVAIIEERLMAERHGEDPPATLQVPAEVQAGIRAMLAERLARLSKRQGTSSGTVQGGTGSTVPGAGAVVPPVGPADVKKDDDEPENGSGPGGPK